MTPSHDFVRLTRNPDLPVFRSFQATRKGEGDIIIGMHRVSITMPMQRRSDPHVLVKLFLVVMAVVGVWIWL